MKKLFILLILLFPFLAAFCQTGEKVYCIWEIAEQPEFLGGDSAMYAFLHETIRYPSDAPPVTPHLRRNIKKRQENDMMNILRRKGVSGVRPFGQRRMKRQIYENHC